MELARAGLDRRSETIVRQASDNQNGTVPIPDIEQVIEDAAAGLRGLQRDDGHWLFELEADATIPAEYILLNHFLDEIDPATEARLGTYIRGRQGDHGGWPLFRGGAFDISCTVKAYYALKLIGDDPEAPHMVRARKAVLAAGGAARCNVFTRITLALFGQVPWRAVPAMPVEVINLPRWFPFHLDKVSYWSRTTIVPLTILLALKPRAKNPRGVDIAELFTTPAEREWRYFPRETLTQWSFLTLDRALSVGEKAIPGRVRRRAIDRALDWCMTRLNGEDGLGAIFPPMANVIMAFDALGYGRDHPPRRTARRAVDLLLTEPVNGSQYCQPCVSPVWDTGLAALSLLECDGEEDRRAADDCLPWLADLQICDVAGDWAATRPHAKPGGWAFQYRNDYYPDVDDTAVVAMALHRADPEAYREAIERAADWIVAMQNENGGWGAFDAENEHYALNHIPFADHGALLDPATADVSARCVSFLCQIGYGREHATVAKGLAYLRAEAGGERLLVRPLGHQLHLRHLVGALRAERRRRGPGIARRPQGGRMARSQAARRRRMGRDRRQLLCRAHRARVRRGLHPVADRVGPARADGRRRSQERRGAARHRVALQRRARGREVAGERLHGRRLPARLLPLLPRL